MQARHCKYVTIATINKLSTYSMQNLLLVTFQYTYICLSKNAACMVTLGIQCSYLVHSFKKKVLRK